MKRYGYHRTSTREQHLDRGIKEITTYCEQKNLELEKIFTDQQTGKNFNRTRYRVLKNQWIDDEGRVYIQYQLSLIYPFFLLNMEVILLHYMLELLYLFFSYTPPNIYIKLIHHFLKLFVLH